LSAARSQALRDAFATSDVEAAPAVLRIAMSLLEYAPSQEVAPNAKSCAQLLAKCGHHRQRDTLFKACVKVFTQLRTNPSSSDNATRVDDAIALFISVLNSSGWVHTRTTLATLREDMSNWDGNAYRAAVAAHAHRASSRYDQRVLGLSVMSGDLTRPPRDAV